jgi:hypothetical protein
MWKSPLLPLWSIRQAVRNRHIEYHCSRRDAEAVARGNEAAHYGNALADATLYHPDNPIKRKDKTKYTSMYQFNPDKILALRDCKQFIDMVSWHASVRNWHHTLGFPK